MQRTVFAFGHRVLILAGHTLSGAAEAQLVDVYSTGAAPLGTST